jgi:hypothetical protein
MNKINFLVTFVFLFLFGCYGTGLQQFNEWKKNHIKNYPTYNFSAACSASDPTGQNKTRCGFAGDVLQSQANENALKLCRTIYSDCVVVQENDNYVYSSDKYQRQLTQKNMDSYIKQCEYIGFKRNTEKMGECVLKISQTEKQIVDVQVNNSGSDTLANLIILQESLKLLQPPTSPRKNVQCTYNTVGGILGVNCF